jgi:hypothetical protein
MSLRSCGIGASAILALAFLSTSPVAADEETPDYVIVDGKRVPTRVVPPADDAATRHEELGRMASGQATRGAQEQPPPGRSKVKARPRITVRDLRALEGYHALDDERETFDRFLRFRRKLLDQGFPADGYYYSYNPYRSLVREYVDISEYERFRRTRDRHRREMETRRVRLLTQHEKALFAGLARLERGDAKRAIVALTLAAKLNQGDPACRLHLAQARLAQGHYLEAGLALRRALELQPKLVYADLHLDSYYANAHALDRYTEKLAGWVREHPARAEVYFLLGFLEFQRGDFAAAHLAFERVQQAMPEDCLTRDFAEITKPASTE